MVKGEVEYKDKRCLMMFFVPQLCLAYFATTFPTLKMDVQYYDANTRARKTGTFECQPDTAASFQSWDYTCIDLNSCFNSYGGGLAPEATHIYFDSSAEYWIDEVTLGTSERTSKYTCTCNQ